MKLFKRMTKIAAAVFAVTAMTAMATAAADVKLSDIGSHWSKTYVEYGVEKGYINGYPDGTFLPDNPVSRAEFAKMINSSVGITKKTLIDFFDVEEDLWYYPEIQKAVYAGYVSGYEDGSFRPANRITRQETAVILSRIATRAEKTVSLDGYKDKNDIADWAKAAVEFACAKGYITGDDLGQLLPKAVLTRGQAAKIIYLLVTGETIQNGTYTVAPGNAICPEILFTDDVIFESDAKKPSLVLDGCRVLGKVSVNTDEKATVTIKDSGLNVLTISGAGADVDADGSTVKYTELKAPGTLSGDGIDDIYLSGDKLLTGVVTLPQTGVNSLHISSDAIIHAGVVGSVEIAETASVIFQNGDIEKMEVAKGADGSTVTLAAGVTVETLTVNAETSFMGGGKIENAKNNVSGVTYEEKPEKLSGIVDGSGKEDSSSTSGKDFVPSAVNPKASAKDVAVSSDITLSFVSSIYDDDGDKPSDAYLADCVELRKKSATGSQVDIDVTMSLSSRVVIKPHDDLEEGTRYYVIVKKGKLYDADGNKNGSYTYSFTTRDGDTNDSDTSYTVTFDPERGTDNVSVSDTFKITFSSAVRDADGTALTNSYLTREGIELRAKSLTGERVEISATISSTKRIITVKTEEALAPDTRYYLIVPSGKLEYTNGNNISRVYTYFNTSDQLDVTVTPENGSTGIAVDTEILLKFNGEIYRPAGSNVTSSYLSEKAIELHRSSTTGTKIDFTAVMDSDRKTVRVIPSELESGTRYYIVIPAGVIANESGTENSKLTSSFTTASVMAPSIKPVHKSEDVLPTDNVTITFTEALYDRDKKPITAEYVAEKVVKLRKTSSSGTEVPFDAAISADYTTITLIPKTPFTANATYYVSVAKSTLYNAAGKANTAATSTFTTALSGAPDFLPYNGEEEVDVASTVDITFDRKMYAIGGAELTATYVKNNVVELYKNGYDGTAVAFSVSLSSDKQTITVKPTAKMDGETLYYVVVRKSSLEDSSGNENALYTSSFTTAEVVNTDVTIEPANRATAVPVTSDIIVTFESAVYRSGGSIASGSYLVNNVFELRKGTTSSAKKIECTATISDDNKVMTVTPVEPLEPKTTYNFRILAGSLQYSNGTTKVAAKSITFTTGDGKPVLNSVRVTESGASYVTAEVVSAVDGIAYVTVYDGSEAVAEESASIAAGEKALVTVKGLAANRSFTVQAYVKDASGEKSAVKSATAKTTNPFTLEVAEVTDSAVTVLVNALCDGELSLQYKNRTTGESADRVTGLSLAEGAEREFTISGLDSATEYDIIADFADDFGSTLTLSQRVKTLAPKEEVLEITDLVIIDKAGDTYSAKIVDGKAELTTEKTEFIRLRGESSVKNAVFTYNAGEAVEPGKDSAEFTVTPGESTVIAVVLTSGDTGHSVTCEVTVNVHE